MQLRLGAWFLHREKKGSKKYKCVVLQIFFLEKNMFCQHFNSVGRETL